MPKVPTYDSQQVQTRALPNVQQRVDTRGAFGQQFSNSLVNAGQQVFDIGLKIKREDDEAAIKDAVTQTRSAINKVQYEGDDAYFGKKGENAYKDLIPGQERLEEIRKEHSKNLTPEQAKKYNEIMADYLVREKEGMSKYALGERRSWQNEQDEALVIQAQKDAMLRWNDTEPYEDQIRSGINNIAARNGWSPEKRKLKIEESLSTLHVSNIENLIQQDPDVAEDYFKKHGDNISPQLHGKIRDNLDEAQDDKWSLKEADRIFANFESDVDRYDEARKIKDPERRKLVMGQLDRDIARQKRADAERALDVYNKASLDLEEPNTSPLQWKLEHPDKWELMTPSQRDRLMDGNDVETDINVYYEIKGLLLTGESDQALQVLNNNAGVSLSNSDARRLIDQMTKPPKPEKPRKTLITQKESFNMAVESLMGPEPPKKKKGAREDWNKKRAIIAGMIDERFAQWEEANPNKEMSQLERDEILARLNYKIKDEGLFFDEELDMGDLTAEQIEAARRALTKGGYPITPQLIMEAHKLTL